MNDRDMLITVDCKWRGESLSYRHIIGAFEMDGVVPMRGPLSAQEAAEMMQSSELRRRVVDMVSGKIAHAITDALLKYPNRK